MRFLIVALFCALSYAQTECCPGGFPCDLEIVPNSDDTCGDAALDLLRSGSATCTEWLELYCPVTCGACPAPETIDLEKFNIIPAPVPESTGCTTFVVGSCPCDPSDLQADFYFLLDSSSTIPEDVFVAYKTMLAEAFDDYYVNGPRYSIIEYSNIANVVSLHTTTEEIASSIRGLEHIGGGTWHRRALENVLSTYNNFKSTYVLLFTDGQSSHESMGICDADGNPTPIVQDMLDAGIVITPMLLVGGQLDRQAVECLPASPIDVDVTAPGFSPYEMYFTTDCTLPSQPVNFAGAYSRAGTSNGKSQYWNVERDMWARWTGDGWEFTGPEMDPLIENSPGLGGYRPVNASDYTQNFVIFPNLHICCSAEDPFYAIETGAPTSAIPSQTPSVQPTDIPTKCPSVKPTKQPSMENCDHITDTEEVINCLKIELEEVNDIITDLKSDIEDLSEDVNGRCEAAYNRLENSLDTCGTLGR